MIRDSEKTLSMEITVRSCDTDSFGHVNNAVYLNYCEAARNEYMLQRGLGFRDFEKWRLGPVLTSAMLEFKSPAHTDDRLVVYGALSPVSPIRFTIDHEIVTKGDRRLVCTAKLGFAFVNLDTGRPSRIPAPFLQAFESQGI